MDPDPKKMERVRNTWIVTESSVHKRPPKSIFLVILYIIVKMKLVPEQTLTYKCCIFQRRTVQMSNNTNIGQYKHWTGINIGPVQRSDRTLF